MSEQENPGAFLEAASAEAAAQVAQRLLEAGRAAELSEAVLAEVGAEQAWRRYRALERVAEVAPPQPLLEHFVAALRDGANAERRNAARSILAAMAGPEAAGSRVTLGRLEQLVTADSDPDVRLLAASALGESGNPAARPALERTLHDAQSNVVSAAAEALGSLGDVRAAAALAGLIERGDFWSQTAAVVALGRLRERAGVPALAAVAGDPLLAEAVADALGEIGDPAGFEPLRTILESGSAPARRAAHRAAATILSRHPSHPLPDWLRASLRGQEEALAREVREAGDDCAARLLGVAGTRLAAEQLTAILAREELRPTATAALALLPAAVALPVLLARLPGAEAEERAALLSSLPPLADPAHVREVLPYLADADATSRAAAVEALGRSPEPAVLAPLLEALADPGSRLAAAQALGRLGPARCTPLTDLLDDADPRIRAGAAEGLARCAAEEGERIRAALRRETDLYARDALIRALGAAGGGEAVQDLAPLLQSEEVVLRFAAARALGGTRAPEALAPLLQALLDPAPEVQAAALRSLGKLGDVRAAEPVARHLDAPSRDLRRTAAAALRELAPPAAVERLLRALDEPDWEIRLAAVQTLGRIAAPAAVPALQRVAQADPDPLVRERAAEALRAVAAAEPAREDGNG